MFLSSGYPQPLCYPMDQGRSNSLSLLESYALLSVFRHANLQIQSTVCSKSCDFSDSSKGKLEPLHNLKFFNLLKYARLSLHFQFPHNLKANILLAATVKQVITTHTNSSITVTAIMELKMSVPAA